ncbi:MAG: hypothetical protein SH809_02605 [Rhodothermales bacterium]|nr:hypothetical protein [Rhodothermales bacterium]
MKNILILCAVLFSATAPAIAQDYRGRLDLTPFVGALVPMNDVVKAGALATGAPAAKHQVDLLFGGKLTYWFGEAIGIEADIALAPNALESDALGIPGSVDARFFAANARIVQVFARDNASPALLLSGGIGFFATSYDELDMTTGGLGVLGIGFRLPIGGFALQLEAEDFISTTRWELPDGDHTDKIMQNDIRLSVGLVVPLVR